MLIKDTIFVRGFSERKTLQLHDSEELSGADQTVSLVA